MRTTRTYQSGCTWCNGRGFVPNPNSGMVTDTTVICPVCSGAKTIPVTETIEDSLPVQDSLPSDEEINTELNNYRKRLINPLTDQEDFRVEVAWKYCAKWMRSKLQSSPAKDVSDEIHTLSFKNKWKEDITDDEIRAWAESQVTDCLDKYVAELLISTRCIGAKALRDGKISKG